MPCVKYKSCYHRFIANPTELVGATPLHLLSQTALPLKSPTGAFIALLRFANAVPPQTLLRTDEEELCQIDTIPPQPMRINR